MKKYFWKLRLSLNLLTTHEENDYIAEVSTVGNTKHNIDVAKAIKDETRN
ncbi:MAG: hypothetical protein LBD91_05790 [Prevotellaceae bacterium]|jgi:hypothetical protein|nr:hypothetical protein [Prevotellaceae bacterium]